MNKPLYEYLENARKLENDIYACDVTIDKLGENINELNRKIEDTKFKRDNSYYWPECPKEVEPPIDKPKHPDVTEISIFCAVITCFILFSCALFYFTSKMPVNEFTSGPGVIIFILSALVGFGIYYAINMVADKKYDKKSDAYNKIKNELDEKRANDYEEILENYRKQLDDECLRYQTQINTYEKRIDDINKQKAPIRQVLDQYYSANIVYPKYRGLIPITMFCEYIDSGRCTTLEGHEGAYNIYENELRQNIIITKLDGITNKLDSIKSSQYLLYNAITDANNISNRLVSSFSSYADQQAQANAMQLISNRAVVDSNNALKSLAEKNLEELRNLTR